MFVKNKLAEFVFRKSGPETTLDDQGTGPIVTILRVLICCLIVMGMLLLRQEIAIQRPRTRSTIRKVSR